jgi:hypothetical protein
MEASTGSIDRARDLRHSARVLLGLSLLIALATPVALARHTVAYKIDGHALPHGYFATSFWHAVPTGRWIVVVALVMAALFLIRAIALTSSWNALDTAVASSTAQLWFLVVAGVILFRWIVPPSGHTAFGSLTRVPSIALHGITTNIPPGIGTVSAGPHFIWVIVGPVAAIAALMPFRLYVWAEVSNRKQAKAAATSGSPPAPAAGQAITSTATGTVASLTGTCPSCGRETSLNARRCRRCGQDLG